MMHDSPQGTKAATGPYLKLYSALVPGYLQSATVWPQEGPANSWGEGPAAPGFTPALCLVSLGTFWFG